MFNPRLSRLPLASLLVATALFSLLVAACGTEEAASPSDESEAAPAEEAAGVEIRKVTPSDRMYTIEDLKAAGLKTLHHYDVAELPEAMDAWHAMYKVEGNALEYEARFYASHEDAVEYGTPWAETVSGEDAIVIGDEVWWEEGHTHRRKCSRGAGTPHSGCSYSARYGDFITLGNVILLCEGPNPHEALLACKAVLENLD